MMNRFLRLFVEDPPPALVIELTADGVVAVLRDPSDSSIRARAEKVLAPGTLDPAPTRPNIANAAGFAAGLGAALDDLGPRSRSETALILPDASSRLTVLDFDHLPGGADERLKAIRARLEKSVPFDIEAARISYQVTSSSRGQSALVALTPAEIVRQYEDALARFGLWSGFVSISSAAALNLVPVGDMTLFAKLAPSGALTLAAVDGGAVQLVRNVELGSVEGRTDGELLDEMLAEIFPTQAFVADSLGQSVEELLLCGFGDLLAPALTRFPKELGCSVHSVKAGAHPVGQRDAGLAGYLSQGVERPR